MSLPLFQHLRFVGEQVQRAAKTRSPFTGEVEDHANEDRKNLAKGATMMRKAYGEQNRIMLYGLNELPRGRSSK